jgi:hypothetical protein
MGQVGQVHELLKYFGERTGTVKSPNFDRAFTNNNFYSITLADPTLKKIDRPGKIKVFIVPKLKFLF